MPEKRKDVEPYQVYFVQNFPSLVKQARERKAMTREQLAEKIKEKAFVVERIEKGMRPERSVAEKLERELGIRLISSVDSEKTVFKPESSGSLTLGDVVVVKKRKK